MQKIRPHLIYNCGILSGVILFIWACFHPEMDLKATKMAFMANSSGNFFFLMWFLYGPIGVFNPTYHPFSILCQTSSATSPVTCGSMGKDCLLALWWIIEELITAIKFHYYRVKLDDCLRITFAFLAASQCGFLSRWISSLSLVWLVLMS